MKAMAAVVVARHPVFSCGGRDEGEGAGTTSAGGWLGIINSAATLLIHRTAQILLQSPQTTKKINTRHNTKDPQLVSISAANTFYAREYTQGSRSSIALRPSPHRPIARLRDTSFSCPPTRALSQILSQILLQPSQL